MHSSNVGDRNWGLSQTDERDLREYSSTGVVASLVVANQPRWGSLMRNVCLTLAYDGTNYVGWQVQPNGPSVQAKVEEAIEKLTGESARLLVAGRTDSGVHALGQVANFETESRINCCNLRSGIQNFLPDDIVVRQAADVGPEFHATYSAKQKQYRYVIQNSQVRDPFLRKYTHHVRTELDSSAMHAAAQVLVGTHDFRSFETQFPNKATSVRTVTEVTVERHHGCPIWSQQVVPERHARRDGEFIWLEIVADGFLYNMVRAIVGTLLRVGRQTWTAKDVVRILESRDRSQGGETAPAHGLYLVSVEYE